MEGLLMSNKSISHSASADVEMLGKLSDYLIEKWY